MDAAQAAERITALDATLHACTTLLPAAGAPAGGAAGGTVGGTVGGGALAGLTVAVKDNIDVAGTVRTDGLPGPYGPPAAADASVVARLRSAGATPVAKTNLEELGFGATTQNATWGACRNPWDVARIPGGSSGGSAVAVAAGYADIALGTDTGGSLRNPAGFCGVTTLRPTHGLLPTDGMSPLAPSMDVVGAFTGSAALLGEVMSVLSAGAVSPHAVSLREVRVAVPDEAWLTPLADDVAAGFDALLVTLSRRGATVRTVPLPPLDEVAEAMAALQNAEAARTLRPYWSSPRVSPGVQARIELGRSIGTGAQRAAAAVLAQFRSWVDGVFGMVDVIATPATPFPAPVAAADDLVLLSRRINRFLGCWCPLGLPALALPLPLSPAGLPVGAQLVASRGHDGWLLGLGSALQSVTDWHLVTPPLLP